MKRIISSFAIKEEWKKNHLVIAEFSNEKSVNERAIVYKTFEQSFDVETIYGIVFPKGLYSFDNAREAQEFINAV